MERFELNWKEASLKVRSKSEMYTFLTQKCKLYLPPKSQINSEYVYDIFVGEKKALPCNKVVITSVPMLDGLRIDNILDMARDHCDIDAYLPDLKSNKKPSRVFVCNVDKLQDLVNNAMTKREEKYLDDRNLKTLVMPEIKNTFETMTEVSRNNGRFHIMVRNADKRRHISFMQKMKQESAEASQAILKDRDEEIQMLRGKLNDFDKIVQERDRNASTLHNLLKSGIINEYGEPIDNEEDKNSME